jgi:neopullulanase
MNKKEMPLSEINSKMNQESPCWVFDAVFYQIFPDRFDRVETSGSKLNFEPWHSQPTFFGYKGGNFEGIRRRLDYLQDLGVTALYLNPIFASTANHRYHTYDYFKVDPILGSHSDFQRFMKDIKSRNMRVILDGVFNHASRGFYQFNHTLENGIQSPYLNWFHFDREKLQQGIDAYHVCPEKGEHPHGYEAWWGIPALPKFNTNNPDVRDFIFEVAQFWIDEGIDGWRLDVPAEINDDQFWQEFRRKVKEKNPEAYIVGEIWEDASRWLQGDMFDGVMNYLFSYSALGFFFAKSLDRDLLDQTGFKKVQPLTCKDFANSLKHIFGLYSWEMTLGQLNLVDSHDTPRLINCGSGDFDGLKLVMMCLFTVPGAPCLYYGDEIGMAGGNDPDNRRGFEWDETIWDQDLRIFIKSLIQLRRQSLALRQGEFRIVYCASDVVVYSRRINNEKAIICLNSSHQNQDIVLHLEKSYENSKFHNPLSDLEKMTDNDACVRLHLGARQGQVWLKKNDTC